MKTENWTESAPQREKEYRNANWQKENELLEENPAPVSLCLLHTNWARIRIHEARDRHTDCETEFDCVICSFQHRVCPNQRNDPTRKKKYLNLTHTNLPVRSSHLQQSMHWKQQRHNARSFFLLKHPNSQQSVHKPVVRLSTPYSLLTEVCLTIQSVGWHDGLVNEVLEMVVAYVRRSPGIYLKGLKKITTDVQNRFSHLQNTGRSVLGAVQSAAGY
jgi:hypothetical protein